MTRALRLAAAVGVAWVLAAAAPAARAANDAPARIGYLVLEPLREVPSEERRAFLEGLREFGLVEGTSFELVYRSAEGEPEFLRAMCEELLREKVSLIATVGAEPTMACRQATREVPIVFLAAGDPVGIGVAESLARPGGNATGVSYLQSDLAAKRIEYLRLAVPGARRIVMLWTPRLPESRIETDAAAAAARQLGMTSIEFAVHSQGELNDVLAHTAFAPGDALYVTFATGVIAQNRSAIAEFGLRHKLPIISGWSFMTDAGGLLSYAPDIPAMFRRSAYFVHRVLKGAKPAELPIDRATRIELVVNAGTARAIGIALPPELLLRANRVVE